MTHVRGTVRVRFPGHGRGVAYACWSVVAGDRRAVRLSLDGLVALLDRFGMKVKVDLDDAAADGVSAELVTARLAHALVGVVEAHATHPG
jgi:hypothetical protein